MEHENVCDTNCKRRTQYSHQRIGKGTGKNGNKNTREYHPNDSTVKNEQNTEKSPGDLRRLAATQTPVKKMYRLMLAWKTLKE